MKHSKKTVQNKPKKLSVLSSPLPKTDLYNSDFYKWTKEQANLLKNRQLSTLDLDNLREEIESLGKNDKRSLRNHLIVLLMHLLKSKYQPAKQETSNSWQNSIRNASREIKFLLEDSPSLQNELVKIFPKAYSDAKEDAMIETGLSEKMFPEECPWPLQDLFPFLNKKYIK